jgi:dsRNA-specific ribonuclease
MEIAHKTRSDVEVYIYQQYKKSEKGQDKNLRQTVLDDAFEKYIGSYEGGDGEKKLRNLINNTWDSIERCHRI